MRPVKFHSDNKRASPWQGLGDSKLAVLLKTVQRRIEEGNPPNRQTITRLMDELAITSDPDEAWDMWTTQCKPLLEGDKT